MQTDANTDADSVDSFCKRHSISRPFFYRLLQEGKGPKIIKLGRRTLITRESAAEWRKRMERETEGEAA